jgi:hypothetical protein
VIGSHTGQAPADPAGDDVQPAAERVTPIRFRRVIGSFQLDIPVSIRTELLRPETRLLAVLKWILKAIPAQDRWHAVFSRYVDTVADRVRALGGDPDSVPPDPAGGDEHKDDHGHGDHGDERRKLRGKVVEICYDCTGHFTGFVLWSCGHRSHHAGSLRGVERLVRTALRHDLTLAVQLDDHGHACGYAIQD